MTQRYIGMDGNYGHVFFVLSLVVFGTVYTSIILDGFEIADFFDFRPVYLASEVLRDGGNPYNYTALVKQAETIGIQKPGISYTYPPALAAALMPLTYLGFDRARTFWILLNQLTLACIILGYVFSRRREADGYHILGISVIMMAISDPLRETIYLGQTTLIILGFVAAGLYFLRMRRDALAGLSLGIATVVKLQPGLLLLYLLYKRMYKAFTYAIATFLVVTTLSVILFGSNIYGDYIQTAGIFYSDDVIGVHNKTIISFLGSYVTSFNNPSFIRYFKLLGILVVLALCRNDIRERGTPLDLEYSFVISSMILFSPVYWSHHYVYLLLPYMVIFDYLSGKFSRIRLLLASTSLALVFLHYRYFWVIFQGRPEFVLSWLQLYGGVILCLVYASLVYTKNER